MTTNTDVSRPWLTVIMPSYQGEQWIDSRCNRSLPGTDRWDRGAVDRWRPDTRGSAHRAAIRGPRESARCCARGSEQLAREDQFRRRSSRNLVRLPAKRGRRVAAGPGGGGSRLDRGGAECGAEPCPDRHHRSPRLRARHWRCPLPASGELSFETVAERLLVRTPSLPRRRSFAGTRGSPAAGWTRIYGTRRTGTFG